MLIKKCLLKKILSIQSSTTDDEEISAFLINYIKNNLKLKPELDKFGNIYVTKGEGLNGYKCMISHTDTVHKILKERVILEYNNQVYAMGVVGGLASQVGVGGDDRCGNYLCLQALNDFDDIKVAFFRFEESGCKGSENAEMDFFKDVNFVVEPDRKNNTDFITHTNGIEIASKEFKESVELIYKKHNYTTCFGSSTDVGALKKKGLDVSAFNLSCGYYFPHSDNEIIDLEDLDDCYQLIVDIYDQLGETKFEHKHIQEVYTPYRRTYRHDDWDNEDTQTSFNFRNTVGRTFLTNRFQNNTIDYVDLSDLSNNNTMFKKINCNKYYEYVGNIFIYPIETVKKDYLNKTIYFSYKSNNFYLKENDRMERLPDNDLYQYLFVESGNFIFVYDRLSKYWLEITDATWNNTLKTWRFQTI